MGSVGHRPRTMLMKSLGQLQRMVALLAGPAARTYPESPHGRSVRKRFPFESNAESRTTCLKFYSPHGSELGFVCFDVPHARIHVKETSTLIIPTLVAAGANAAE